MNQAQDSGGEVGLRLRGITQNVKVLRRLVACGKKRFIWPLTSFHSSSAM